jgi:hypothetical protein
MKFIVLWFLYPRLKANILTGTVISRINLWISSLSTDVAIKLYVRTINDGANKQCTRQTIDKVIANLSDSNCVFIVALKFPQIHYTYELGET